MVKKWKETVDNKKQQRYTNNNIIKTRRGFYDH